MPNAEPEYLTVTEVSDMLRISKMSVYRHIARGTFADVMRLGRCVRIPRSSVEQVKRTHLAT